MPRKKEVLASPFVPVEEQPYPIPENWCWTYGSTVLEDMESQRPAGNEFDYIDIDAIDNQKQAVNNPKRLPTSKAPSRASRKLHIGDTVFSLVRPYLKNIAYIDNSLAHCIASTGFFVCTPKALLYDRYLYQLMISPYMVDGLNRYMKGDNSPSIRKDDIEQFPFPLPPLPEQHRIVTRIESLFSKLDEAKEKAQTVVDGFELRKSAILHKAFMGELTERWRKEHGVGLDSWKTSNLSDRFEIVGGVQKKPSRTPKDNPIPYLTVANVFRDRIDLSELRYFEVFDGELDKLRLQDKDILVVEGNGSGNEIGRCAMWHCELPTCIHQNHIIRLRVADSETIPEYVLYFLNSSAGKNIMKERAKTTAGLFNLSTGKIKTIPVAFATVLEQAEIVRILDCLLAQEQQAKEAAEAILTQIDTMKKAILARAFRGELGTNDPEEEWAGELVKMIM